ncbi:MAG: Hsp20/alpha crystallin family protein [Candidatus Zambryskibacteria bacterium]|nr:Hsp20/alpha crystallin family protein [Candidatus Zambryskibacteria bacterium]
MPKKRSFFERLTGSVSIADEIENELGNMHQEEENWINNPPEEGELNVDVYQNSNEIVIKTMVAGVKPEDLDVAISRDMVTIKGKRENERTISDDDYFHKELYWGGFSRSIVLPEEIDVDAAEAVEKHGLLIIRLPKLDKNRSTRLKVRGN